MQELAEQATNQKRTSVNGEHRKVVDNIQLIAWTGLLIRAGMHKGSLRPVDELFDIKTCAPIYRASMSHNRLKEHKRCIKMMTCLFEMFEK